MIRYLKPVSSYFLYLTSLSLFPSLGNLKDFLYSYKNAFICYTNTLGLFTSDKAKIVYVREKRETLLNYVSFYGTLESIFRNFQGGGVKMAEE